MANLGRPGSFLAAVALVCSLPTLTAAEVTNPTGVAVIIGNAAYQGGLPEVTYAGNDATAFRAYVIDVLGYDPANIIDLPDASKAQIEATFGNARTHQGRLWRLVEPGISEVVVFYSGHGVPGADNRAYLLPVDADPDVPEINGYALELLYGNLAKLGALSVAVYIDACFSGQSFGGALSRTSGLGISPALPAAPGGFGVLTAAAADQVAVWDDQAKHGVFTKHLLEALYGAADGEGFGNGDNVITLTEAKAYLDVNMTRAARRIGREQDPSMDGNGALVLAAFGPDGPPAAVVAALDEVLDVEMFALANVNVRAGPTAQTEKLVTISNGDPVAVTGKTGDWFQIALADGRTGYILGRYLGAGVPEPAPPPPPNPGEIELAFWDAVKDTTNPAELEAYLTQYPAGRFAALANAGSAPCKSKQISKRRPNAASTKSKRCGTS